MSSEPDGLPFLREALGLVATYFYSEAVGLDKVAIGTTVATTDEEVRFMRELEFRHALACAAELESILPLIERETSRQSVLVREESRGAVRGRLDTAQYIARRQQQASLPRSYPVLTNKDSPDTPENCLVAESLRRLTRQVAAYPNVRGTAEGLQAARLHGWLRARLRRWPWQETRRSDSLNRLEMETALRVRKRQTGNQQGYARFLEWLAEWRMDLTRLGDHERSRLMSGILAFPTDDFFWNRVFEIWTLSRAAKALIRCGCELLDGPLPLVQRTSRPIYRFTYHGRDVSVWFQRQEPLGTAKWRYLASSRPLTGIPDVVITAPNSGPLLVDAKYRWSVSETRPEETYKMLGYFENFNSNFPELPMKGALVFVGDTEACTVLNDATGGVVTVIVVSSKQPDNIATLAGFDRTIADWLAD